MKQKWVGTVYLLYEPLRRGPLWLQWTVPHFPRVRLWPLPTRYSWRLTTVKITLIGPRNRWLTVKVPIFSGFTGLYFWTEFATGESTVKARLKHDRLLQYYDFSKNIYCKSKSILSRINNSWKIEWLKFFTKVLYQELISNNSGIMKGIKNQKQYIWVHLEIGQRVHFGRKFGQFNEFRSTSSTLKHVLSVKGWEDEIPGQLGQCEPTRPASENGCCSEILLTKTTKRIYVSCTSQGENKLSSCPTGNKLARWWLF